MITNTSNILTSQVCHHCGDDCANSDISIGDKLFCCHGCLTVYHILSENDLDLFYQLNEKSGLSQRNKNDDDYAYLEDVDMIKRLVTHMQEGVTTVWLSLPTIHCSSCLWLLENLPRLDSGVLKCTVNFLDKKALIQFDNSQTSLRSVVRLLHQIGYPPKITLQDLEEKNHTSDKSYFYRLGVAGFCFGNIMLLSFPEYFGLSGLGDSFASVIHRANFLLVLPVVLYSAREYYVSAWNGIKKGNLNIDVPIVIGVIALFVKSLMDISSGTSPGYFDSIAGLIFFLLIGKWMQTATYRRIQFDLDYKSYFPIVATRLSRSEEEKISLQSIEKSDILIVRHEELIPADGILLSQSAEIDYSFVTGESEPVLVEQGDQIYCGGKLYGSSIQIEVTKTVDTSYLVELWDSDMFSKSSNQSQISSINDWVSRYFTWIILILSACAYGYYSVTASQEVAIHVFISVLIVACPCAVALAIPFTFGNLIRLLAKQGIFVKNTQVVEKLSDINDIVFDKTGTLTAHDHARLDYVGESLSGREIQLISSLVSQSTHKMSLAIKRYYASEQSYEVLGYIEEVGKGIQAEIDGSIVRIGSNKFLAKHEIEVFDQKFQTGPCNVYLSIDDQVVGGFVKQSRFHDYLRSILKSLSSKYRLSLLSGDQDSDKETLMSVFSQWFKIQFEQSPYDKLSMIQNLQESSGGVCMIGDGLNDSGALKQADVGIGVIEESSGFSPACDIVMELDKLSVLPQIFKVANKAMVLIYINYALAIMYNLIGLFFAIFGLLSPLVAAILMPISSITVVVFGYLSSLILVKKTLKS